MPLFTIMHKYLRIRIHAHRHTQHLNLPAMRKEYTIRGKIVALSLQIEVTQNVEQK